MAITNGSSYMHKTLHAKIKYLQNHGALLKTQQNRNEREDDPKGRNSISVISALEKRKYLYVHFFFA